MKKATPLDRSLTITRAASFWYPTMLAQEAGQISESKAAELLGLSIVGYRTRKRDAIRAVMNLVDTLPSPISSIAQALVDTPEIFDGR